MTFIHNGLNHYKEDYDQVQLDKMSLYWDELMKLQSEYSSNNSKYSLKGKIGVFYKIHKETDKYSYYLKTKNNQKGVK